MTQWHMKSRRKSSGGLKKTSERCTKKLAWKGREPTETAVSGEGERFALKGRGGNKKEILALAEKASVVDPKTNKLHRVSIVRVVKNKANRDYVRRNIITKGAIIEVEVDEGTKHAIVTSRPGQHGVVQAKIVDAS